MPHYSDGSEAKLGDHVKGKPYNTPHEVTGVVVGIIPDSESCNLRVAFTRPFKQGDHRALTIGGYDHDPVQTIPVTTEVDYGETKAFVKVA